MPRFSDRFLEELTDKNDIESVVSEYVTLTKRSGSNRFGLCPFHSEKTPSFSVSPDKQLYKCFGCGKGGGVISFIMEVEHLSFPDAVAFLARRAGMELPEEENTQESSRRKRLLELNRAAALYFRDCLFNGPDPAGREYLTGRGISAATATRFGLGYAPAGWDNLKNAMLKQGYTERELMEADLIKQGSRGSSYDRFRSRLVFPVISVQKNVLAFSGRIIGEGEPKYLNSGDTPLFKKGHNLFGLNLAKNSKDPFFLLVEGNVDVVTLHQAGFTSAVAALGTALTEDQARLLSRYKNEIILCYDSDTAGRNATRKAVNIFKNLDVKVRVLTLDGGSKDPDEYIRANGADAFRNRLEEAKEQAAYRFEQLSAAYRLDEPEGRAQYLKEAVKFIATLPETGTREIYAGLAAEKAGVTREGVLADVKRILRRRQNEQAEHKSQLPTQLAQPREKELHYGDLRSAKAEEDLLALLYYDGSLFDEPDLPAPEEFSSPLLGRFFTELRSARDEGRELTPNRLAESCSPAEISLFTKIIQKDEDLSHAREAVRDCVRVIRESADKQEDLLALVERKRKSNAYGG